MVSIRSSGKRLAATVTATVGILSLGVAGIASLALWSQATQAKASANTQTGNGGLDSQNQPEFRHRGDREGGDDGGQQGSPVGPSQNFAPQAQSSGS